MPIEMGHYTRLYCCAHHFLPPEGEVLIRVVGIYEPEFFYLDRVF